MLGHMKAGSTARFASKGWYILAFEPENTNRENFLLQHASNQRVVCVPRAVSDSSGDKIPFYTSDVHYGIHSIKPFHETHQAASYEVETITLKDALEEYNIDHVSFLKVDIEGADFLALKGFDWDRITPEVVMVEFMDHRSQRNFGYTHHDMALYMRNKGYVCFVSEWAPIKEYGIKGQKGEPHTWLQCVPYPLDHEPSWGNLIFVPKGKAQIFARTLKRYLRSLKRKSHSGFRVKDIVLIARNLARKYFSK